MPENHRFSEVNVGQAFLGFLWTILYTDISRKVFEATSSALPAFVPIQVIKGAYVGASLILTVGLVHLFWLWYTKLHALENSQRNHITLPAFIGRSKRVLLLGLVVVSAVSGFIIVTVALFPQGEINGYEASFAALIWPAWMVSIVMAVYDRLEQEQPEQKPRGKRKRRTK